MDLGQVHDYNPLDAEAGVHVTLYLSEEDHRRIEAEEQGYRGIITDVRTGIRYRAFSVPCGVSGCDCRAVVVMMSDRKTNGRAGES